MVDARALDEQALRELRAIAGDFAFAQAQGWPQMIAFSSGEPFDLDRLAVEIHRAVYQLLAPGTIVRLPAHVDALTLRQRLERLERYVRAEQRRADYRRRLAEAAEGLAEWGEPLDALQARVDVAYPRGLKRRRAGALA